MQLPIERSGQPPPPPGHGSAGMKDQATTLAKLGFFIKMPRSMQQKKPPFVWPAGTGVARNTVPSYTMSAAQGPAPVPAPHCAGAGVGVGVGVGVGRSAGMALAVPGLGRCPVTAVKNVQFPSDD